MSQSYYIFADDPRSPGWRDNLIAFIHRLPLKKSWKIEVSEYHQSRKENQNNALWGVAYPAIKDATGYDVNELHTAMCGSFFGWRDAEIMGVMVRKPFRTTTRDETGKKDIISRSRFYDFYLHVQLEAAGVGIDVPNPIPKTLDGWQD